MMNKAMQQIAEVTHYSRCTGPLIVRTHHRIQSRVLTEFTREAFQRVGMHRRVCIHENQDVAGRLSCSSISGRGWPAPFVQAH